jgi:hypothetical protein
LRLWKDTDPDIPILKEAKAEYAEPAVRSNRRSDSFVFGGHGKTFSRFSSVQKMAKPIKS